jgi:predicted HD superfamily hydrolase involved in NAD metabolism
MINNDKTQAIIKYLKENLSAARYKHTLGTVKTALGLAKTHKADINKTYLAALLHDAGKSVSKDKLTAYVKKHNILMPYKEETLKYNPWIIHGFVSAHIAKNIFNIKDKEILQAIYSHTIGGDKMTKLDKVIYLADITAPDRRHWSSKILRWHAKRNLDRAMQMAIASKIKHVLANKKWLHPVALASWNSLTTS